MSKTETRAVPVANKKPAAAPPPAAAAPKPAPAPEPEEAEETNGAATNGHAEPVDPKPLFAAYTQRKAAVVAAEKVLEKAKGALSDAIGAIKTGVGVGPFVYQGQTLQIVSRETKGADGSYTTHYFKQIGNQIQTIE